MSSETPPRSFTLQFDDLEALELDVANNLSRGRAFAPGVTQVCERERCELTLLHPVTGDTLAFGAEAVWVSVDGPGKGAGFQLLDFDSSLAGQIQAFVVAKSEASSQCGAGAEVRPATLMEQVRGYTGAEQLKAAREGALSERVALERVYGKAVWEALMQNPRVTVPEVARIARKGNIPRPLVEVITSNPAWLSSPEVRRALLSNPRLGGIPLDKVLRALSRSELRQVANQVGYPAPVRQAAKKLQGR